MCSREQQPTVGMSGVKSFTEVGKNPLNPTARLGKEGRHSCSIFLLPGQEQDAAKQVRNAVRAFPNQSF